MDNNPNFFEYTVQKKNDGSIFIKRFLIYTAFLLPAIILSLIFGKYIFIAVPFIFLFSAFGVWFFLRYTKIEYEYQLISGDFNIAFIYDNRSRKQLAPVKIKDMEKAAPYNDENIKQFNLNEIKNIKFYCTSPRDENLYFFIYKDAKEGRSAVVFNCDPKMLKIMKFYNSQNVIVTYGSLRGDI